MTWSIIARDPDNGLIGMAIASRFFAVGAMCMQAQNFIGAASTQALMNPTLAPRALALLREGLKPHNVCDIVTAADVGAAFRQLHLMDWHGRTAAHTGANCAPWCGHLSEQDISVAGNWLVGPEVIADTLQAFKENTNLPIVERLLAAMTAGQIAGGDIRGKQSAALFVQGEELYPRFSMRTDDNPEPLIELYRLYKVAKEQFIPFSASFPTVERPCGIIDRTELDAIMEAEKGKPLGALSEVFK